MTRDQMVEGMRDVDAPPNTFETHHRRKDGTLVDVEVSVTHVKLETETLHYVVVRDITERKRAAAALAEEAARRRVLFEQSKDGIVITDVNGRTIEANQSLFRMLGYSAEEMRQLYVWDWEADMTREQVLGGRGDLRALQNFETHHRRKDGTLVDVEVSVTKISLAAELFFYAVVRDITKHKRAAAALAKEATRRRVLFEQSKDGIAVLDASGRTIESNQSFLHMLGYSAEGNAATLCSAGKPT